MFPPDDNWTAPGLFHAWLSWFNQGYFMTNSGSFYLKFKLFLFQNRNLDCIIRQKVVPSNKTEFSQQIYIPILKHYFSLLDFISFLLFSPCFSTLFRNYKSGIKNERVQYVRHSILRLLELLCSLWWGRISKSDLYEKYISPSWNISPLLY